MTAHGEEALAEYGVGMVYANGMGVAKDEAAAFPHLRKAADMGLPAAQYALAVMCEGGRGTRVDEHEALRWYEKAAKHGHHKAQYNYALALLDRGDEGGAVQYLERSAAQGYSEAQALLGELYEAGDGVAVDLEKALYWFEQAAEEGHADGLFCLGLLYANGKGVEADEERAAGLFLDAAEQDHGDAAYNLALMYKRGVGVSQSYEEAERWLVAACEQGHEEAEGELLSVRTALALVHGVREQREANPPSAEFNAVALDVEPASSEGDGGEENVGPSGSSPRRGKRKKRRKRSTITPTFSRELSELKDSIGLAHDLFKTRPMEYDSSAPPSPVMMRRRSGTGNSASAAGRSRLSLSRSSSAGPETPLRVLGSVASEESLETICAAVSPEVEACLVDHRHVSIETTLGSNVLGDVLKARLWREEVVLQRFAPSVLAHRSECEATIAAMVRACHPCLVPFRGHMVGGRGPTGVIRKLLPPLNTMLAGDAIQAARICNIMADVCSAVEYLWGKSLVRVCVPINGATVAIGDDRAQLSEWGIAEITRIVNNVPARPAQEEEWEQVQQIGQLALDLFEDCEGEGGGALECELRALARDCVHADPALRPRLAVLSKCVDRLCSTSE